jgi:predicted MPP superfamily phosphohydrolase
MRILHISDFHYRKATAAGRDDHAELVRKLALILESEPTSIDAIFFTGDLVDRGRVEDLGAASGVLLTKLRETLHVPDAMVFLCPGNHDVDRNLVSEGVMQLIRALKDNDSLDKFLLKPTDFALSLDPHSAISDVWESVPPLTSADHYERLYSTYERRLENTTVGIVSLNSAWCSYEEVEKGTLRFPMISLKDAHHRVSHCKVKILLMHHPIEWFGDFNAEAIEDFIHTHFDLMFSGHIHDDRISVHFRSNSGIFETTAPATLTFDKRASVGFSLIDLELEDPSTVSITKFTYDHRRANFEKGEQVFVNVPRNSEKQKQNELRNKLKRFYATALGKANELLLENDDPQGFLTLFTNPVLRAKREAELVGREDVPGKSFEAILGDPASDLLILGDDKYGKTSILYRMQLHLLSNYSTLDIIPFYFDCKAFPESSKVTSLTTLMARSLQMSKNDVESLIEKGKIRLLADNVSTQNPGYPLVVDALDRFSTLSFVATTTPVLIKRTDVAAIGTREATKLYIHDMGRTELRVYTDRCMLGKHDQVDMAMEHVINLCKQMSLPMNHWIVSLLIQIYGKSRDDYTKNLFEVLDLCIDEILNKKKLALVRHAVSYEQYKIICAHVAHYLYTSWQSNIHFAPAADLLQFLTNFVDNDPRLDANPHDILQYLLATQVLKEREDCAISFRINGFFEYFLAYYLKLDSHFRLSVLNDNDSFFAFRNEFELYSGFERGDQEFLLAVHAVTIRFTGQLMALYVGDSIDEILVSKAKQHRLDDITGHIELEEPLDENQRDNILDQARPIHIQSEVRAKGYDTSHAELALLAEQAQRVLGRSLKNMDQLRNTDVIDKVFEDLVRPYCYLAFKVIDAFNAAAITEGAEDMDRAMEMLELASNFVPLYVESALFDAVGHKNMRKVIDRRIKLLGKNATKNQFELFLLSLLLVDSDIKANLDRLDNLIDLLDVNILKYSVYLKLHYYLSFRTGQDEKLQAELRARIQSMSKGFDKSADLSALHRRFSKISERSVARKRLN